MAKEQGKEAGLQMWHKKFIKNLNQKNGQSLIEYAMVVAIVSSALVAMSTYVFRSVQATQSKIQKEMSK